MSMDFGIANKRALVTGGSQGIGRSTAKHFAAEGAAVAITYRHEKERATAVVEEIQAKGGQAMAVFLDLESPDSIADATRIANSRWGGIDILVNNAILWSPTRISESPQFENYPPEIWRKLFRANIEGVYSVIQLVIPAMRDQRWGRIVNVSSIIAEDGMPGASWYSTAKAALHGLTRSLSKELGPAGILVNTVMPGLTRTDRFESVSPIVRARVEEASPIRRVLTPEEIAATIAFLCSASNTAVTGEIVRIGGRTS